MINCNLIFGSGARIVIFSGANILIRNSRLFACEKMWMGIKVHNGSLSFYRNKIEDAQYAIDGGNNGHINVFRNEFRNNHIGVRANLSSSNNFSIGVFNQNEFDSTAPPKPPYDNQSPVPSPAISYAGVFLRNVDGAILNNSEFSRLINGIILDQSTARIRNCNFASIVDFIQYDEYLNYPKGCGIISKNSELIQNGNGTSVNPDFINCTNTGIFSENSDIVSSNNVITTAAYGYQVTGTRFGTISIENNELLLIGGTAGSRVGIFTSLVGDEEVNYSVSNNEITIIEGRAIGISSLFNSTNKFTGNMNGNTFTGVDQPSDATYWFLSTNNLSGNLRIVDNQFNSDNSCNGAGLTYDISTGTSSKVYLIENEFNGNAIKSTDGIYVSDARGFINYCSNTFTHNNRGLTFEGNDLNSNVMYSTFEDNEYGLFLLELSFPTSIGIQKHHQNDWGAGACNGCAFEAFATTNVNINLSLFLVDPTVPRFTANPVNRPNWFQNQIPQPGDTPAFCSFTTTKIVNAADDLLVNDGNLFSTDDVFSWDKKIYVYQKLAPYINEDVEAAELFALLTSQLSVTDIKLFDLPFNLEKALSLSSEDKEKWNDFYLGKKELMDTISNLDKEILDGASHLIAAKIEHINELTTLDSLENELIEHIDTKRVEKLEAFIVDLDNIVVSQKFKKNEIKYYHALANYLKNKQWKPDFYDIIKKIAEGCYEEDGQTVLKARALLDKCDLQEIEDCTENRNSKLSQARNNENQAKISLFPNPNHGGTLHLNLPSTPNSNLCKISINDLSGKAVLSQQIPVVDNQSALDISTLSNGVYFISLEQNENKVTKKLIIQNK